MSRAVESRDRAVERHLPLAPATFEILLTLVGERRHGYAIMKEVDDRTGGRTQLLPGTLYRILARMAQEGVVEITKEGSDSSEDSRRRYYRLSAFGRLLLEAETARLADQLNAARKKKLLPRPRVSS